MSYAQQFIGILGEITGSKDEVFAKRRMFDDVFGGESKRFYKQWSKLFTRAVYKHAKSKTKAWFGARFSAKTTPLHITYDVNQYEIYIWGKPPNKNVGKYESSSTTKRNVPWGKTSEQSSNPDYKWHGEHFHRVFIPNSSIDYREGVIGARRRYDSTDGFWFSAKKKPSSHEGNRWYTRMSHQDILVSGLGDHYVHEDIGPDINARYYPYPVQWYSEGQFDYGAKSTTKFDYDEISLSDEIMNDPELWSILWDTYEQTKNNQKR